MKTFLKSKNLLLASLLLLSFWFEKAAAQSPATCETPIITATSSGFSSASVCEGGYIDLSASEGVSYQWYKDGVAMDGEIYQGISITQVGTAEYSVMVTYAGGCSKMSAPHPASVLPKPAAPTITASGPTNFCQGGSVTLSVSGPGTPNWMKGFSPVPMNEDGSITVTSGGTYKVNIQDNGCTSDWSQISVNVNPAPSISINEVDNGDGTITLTASGANSYNWNTGELSPSILVTKGTGTTYTVTGNNFMGCTGTASYTVACIPPDATISSPSGSNVCEGATLTLSAPGGMDSYLWSNGATTQSINVGGGTYTVTVTRGLCSNSGSFTVNTIARPAVQTITVNGPTTFCAGGSTTNLSVPSGFDEYTWSNNGSFAGITNSLNVSASGSYSVDVQKDGCWSGLATPVNITVNDKPTISITTTNNGNGTQTLTASGADSYAWSTGANTASITVAATGTYTVTGTNASGCTNTASYTVSCDAPTPTITAGGPTTFCNGGSVALTASAGTSYQWYRNGTLMSGNTAQTLWATTAGSYTVRVGYANGCSATSAATTVTVNPKPGLPTITASGSTVLCQGQSVTLTAPAGTGYTYLWTHESLGVIGTTRSISATVQGMHYVRVTNAQGCSTDSWGRYVQVNISPKPSLTTSTGSTAICEGGSITLVAPNGYSNYTWSNGTTSTQTLSVLSAGTWNVRGYMNGCWSEPSDNITTTVTPMPVATITEETVNVSTKRLTAPAGYTYSWSTGETSQSILVSAPGTYTVTCIDGNCSNSASYTLTAAPLPVKWLSINVAKKENKAILTWEVEENEVKEYVIEQSNDGRTYKSVKTVASMSLGHAKSFYTEEVELSQLQSEMHFRIKQVDLDGTYTYSKIMVVRQDQAAVEYLILKNPVPASTPIKFILNKDGRYKIQVMDMEGRKVLADTKAIKKGQLIELHNSLRPGTYIVTAVSDINHINFKVLVQ